MIVLDQSNTISSETLQQYVTLMCIGVSVQVDNVASYKQLAKVLDANGILWASGDRPTCWPASRDLREVFETPRLLRITQNGCGNSALIWR
jgi:hypothetical protein